mgnify:CR=1 FL=1
MSDTNNKKPAYFAYTITGEADEESHWLKIGAAWRHGDGRGLNIVLDALPVNGRLTLRTPKD